MTTPPPDITLAVDPRNPGQFFACCGVLELASRLWPGSEANNWHAPEGWFAKNGSRASFHIATYSGHNEPLGEIVRALIKPAVLVELADDHEAHAQKDRKPIVIVPFGLRLDWWLDSYRGGDKSELKVWAGQQKPDEKLKELREAWRGFVKRSPDEIAAHSLLSQQAPVAGFGFDPQSAWKSINIGFSADEQEIDVLTSPSIEMLAAIGIQRCRPRHVERRTFAYRAWADPIGIAVVPAAIAGAGRAVGLFEFPVVMRNAQYGSFGWAKPSEEKQ
ncbi:MAG: hypothetical protein R3D62_10555 [Xanthobacteraceae bacterium]